jgi:uncharacterized protein YlzI (FlbEa/FlbD family)
MSSFLIELIDEFGETLYLNKFHVSSVKDYQGDLTRIRLSNGDNHYVRNTAKDIKGKLNADK